MGWEEGSVSHVRLFDIRIEDPDGEKVQIQAPVDVKIELMGQNGSGDNGSGDDGSGNGGIDLSGEDTRIIHFADGSGTGEILDDVEISAEGKGDEVTLTFAASGFSVYAIVEAPEPAKITVHNLQELAENADEEFLLSVQLNGYFLNSLNGNSCFNTTKEEDNADGWYLETAGTSNRYYLYTYTKDGSGNLVKRYMRNTNSNNVGLVDNVILVE